MTTGKEESFKEWVKKVALLGEKVGNGNRKDWVRRGTSRQGDREDMGR